MNTFIYTYVYILIHIHTYKYTHMYLHPHLTERTDSELSDSELSEFVSVFYIHVLKSMHLCIYIYRVLNPMPGILACDPMPRIVISGLGFSKLLLALSKMGMGPAGGQGATDPSLNSGLCACTRVSCAPLLTCSFTLPLWRSRMVLWHPPSSWSHTHFAEREQEFVESQAGIESLTWDHRPRSPA